MILSLMGRVVSERVDASGHCGDARRAAIGSTLVERVVEPGLLVVHKLGGTRPRDTVIQRLLSAPSVTCTEMVGGKHWGDRTAAACQGRRIATT